MDSHEEKLLSITQAAKFLGVHPLTLRNWTEKGNVQFYRTPGGHRRFRREELVDFLARMNQGNREPTLVTAARQAVQKAITSLPEHQPIIALASKGGVITEQQRATMRSMGRKLLGLTIQYTAGTADETILNKGREIGRSYGKLTRQHGWSISETVATFNFFRDTIIEITFYTPVNVVDIDTSNPQLYCRINHFFNKVLLATVEAAEEVVFAIAEVSATAEKDN
jgi:excisionase family DNA binding protein